MDSLTTFELLEFAAMMRTSWDLQFQYWLALTFAMAVARFSFADRFTARWRILLASLYITASILFIGRFYLDVALSAPYRDLAIERGAFWINQDWVVRVLTIVRFSVFLLGTAVTTYFLVKDDEIDE